MISKRCLFSLCMVLFCFGVSSARNLRPPHEYGRVIINNYSDKANLAPVVFQHWLHRALFTCRLCHVDIGFAMEAVATKITASANMSGLYCGACHDGKRVYGDRKVFGACSDKPSDRESGRCERCHSLRKKVKREYEFYKFTEKLPKSYFGIDWEKAEGEGLIKPIDFLDGVSIKRPPLKMDRELSIGSQATWMSDVTFSHKKHAIWNGCEVCHPEIFPSTKKGSVKYSMFQISSGQYCGVCHDKVAFSISECERCHAKQVR